MIDYKNNLLLLQIKQSNGNIETLYSAEGSILPLLL